jgi:legumain
MKLLLPFLIIAAIFNTVKTDNFAVLVAGSNQFYNYRHQSDVFHAYQSLLQKGMNPNNIIVLAYDDIANSVSNPIRGKVFNKPTYADAGVDVYNGIKIDYSGADVTPAVFLNVLSGNKTFVKGKGT